MSKIDNEAMYQLGREAHAAGYQTIQCDVRDPVERSFWLAGWHDADIEAGNSVLDKINKP
jgi:ribosome modulation factor